MSIISQNNIKSQETESAISRFLKNYRIGELLYKCNAGKAKGFAVIDVFRYLLSLVFCDRSMYMQISTSRYDIVNIPLHIFSKIFESVDQPHSHGA